MAKTETTISGKKIKRHGQGGDIWKRFRKNKLAMAGLIIFGIIVLIAIFGSFFTPYSYGEIDPINANLSPSAQHLLGTDKYGRDILSRMLYGAKYSLGIGFAAEALSIVLGVFFGALAGYFGGAVDNVILRICDIFQAIPSMLLAVIISQAMGSGFIQTVIALAIGSAPMSARMMRATMLSVREQEFVEAAKAIDCGNMRIIFKHVLPNSLSPMIIIASMGVGQVILNSSGLSYLGLGIQEPLPEWGAMLALGKDVIRYYPYQVIIPGVAIALLILACNLVGDGIRDAMDPKLKS